MRKPFELKKPTQLSKSTQSRKHIYIIFPLVVQTPYTSIELSKLYTIQPNQSKSSLDFQAPPADSFPFQICRPWKSKLDVSNVNAATSKSTLYFAPCSFWSISRQSLVDQIDSMELISFPPK